MLDDWIKINGFKLSYCQIEWDLLESRATFLVVEIDPRSVRWTSHSILFRLPEFAKRFSSHLLSSASPCTFLWCWRLESNRSIWRWWREGREGNGHWSNEKSSWRELDEEEVSKWGWTSISISLERGKILTHLPAEWWWTFGWKSGKEEGNESIQISTPHASPI